MLDVLWITYFSMGFTGTIQAIITEVKINMKKWVSTKMFILSYMLAYFLYYYCLCAIYNRKVLSHIYPNFLLNYYDISSLFSSSLFSDSYRALWSSIISLYIISRYIDFLRWISWPVDYDSVVFHLGWE